MSESYVQTPQDGIGKKLRTILETVGTNDVHSEIIEKLGDLLTKKIIYDASNNPIYVGEAEPGTATSAAGWRIKKITYDANNNPTNVEWADGNTNFDNIMDNYIGYTYS
jgi:hypothetical protein